MDDSRLPLVSVALPLYKSRRFFDILCANLDTLAYPNLEILISDHHCADNALAQLYARYGDDARVRFFAARDEINWVEHFNLLLRAARGKYFFWMPHDDSYARDFVSVLVEKLEQAPDAVLAYGSMLGLHPNGVQKPPRTTAPFSNDAAWTWREPLKLFLEQHLWLASHGMVRRARVVEKNLFLPATRDTNAADIVWTFALACTGRFVWTPQCLIQKRFYSTSTHAQWKLRTWRHSVREFSLLRALLQNSSVSPRERMRAETLALIWTILRLGGNTLDTIRAPNTVDERIRKLLFKLNLW